MKRFQWLRKGWAENPPIDSSRRSEQSAPQTVVAISFGLRARRLTTGGQSVGVRQAVVDALPPIRGFVFFRGARVVVRAANAPLHRDPRRRSARGLIRPCRTREVIDKAAWVDMVISSRGAANGRRLIIGP